jgi:DNA processing protein
LERKDLLDLGLRPSLVRALGNKDLAFQQAEEEWKRLKDLGGSLLTLEEENYPSLLAQIPDPPLVLYFFGQLEMGPYPLAVVGSRSVTSYGRRVVRDWISELARAGLDIVSGLALGVDRLAHEEALRAEGYTVAVLGSGLDQVYPPENRSLAERIVRSGGAIVTEFPLGTPPRAQNFPIRNRIISGLSKAVLVVEASLRSGSLITARLAAEQGREVMAVPGSIYSGRSHGCHQLICQGALLVDKPCQILETLGLKIVSSPAEDASPVNSLTLSPEEDKVLERLEVYPMHVDDLVHLTGLEVSTLSGILLALELKGLIESQPGNYYQKVVKR